MHVGGDPTKNGNFKRGKVGLLCRKKFQQWLSCDGARDVMGLEKSRG